MKNQKFGLIGKTLKHSYSKRVHGVFSDYDYELYELSEDKLKEFVDSDVVGFNVTIPYKREIIKYLDVVDGEALDIGAVNTVVKKNGKIYGYNTDSFGMEYALNRSGISLCDKTVMILGSGGTSQTATSVCKRLGAKKIIIVSRGGEINYQNYHEQKEVQVIINTTPVGMYPRTEESPIDLDGFENLIGVMDVIFNPSITKLLYMAKQKGIKTCGGLAMLVAQAKRAAELFTGESIIDEKIEKAIREIEREEKNILLIGMPGSGKTTVGKELAKRLNREFIDTDLLIEQKANMPIKEIFSNFGEEKFRELETETIKEVGKLSNKVIATGGGIIKREENHFYLSRNSKVFYIKRKIENLATSDRPLSKDLSAVEKLYKERKSLYEGLCNVVIENDSDLDSAIKGVIENL